MYVIVKPGCTSKTNILEQLEEVWGNNWLQINGFAVL